MKKLTFVYSTIMMSSLAVAGQDLPLGPLHVGDPLSKVGRSERRRFNDGWTADGAAVTLPHTWNAVDGADGIPDGVKWSGNSALGEGYYARKCVRYERNLPDPKPGKRYFLRFEGASTKAEVHVNNWPIGRHSGAYTAFTFEITEALQSQSNRVEVVVDNRRDPDMPTISADFTVFGGLYRDVWLYETDPVCVDPTRYPRVLSANPDGGYTIVEVPMLGMDDLHLERRFPHPEPWSPEHPKMYSFDVDFGEGNVLKIPFGFRKAEFRADGFYLNGVKRKLRGVNRHQDRAGKGWAVSHEDEAEDIAFVKRMGADALRTAHYPQSQNLYDLCDREGLVVWCEAPNTDIVTSSPEFRANLLNQVREMVEQYGNHPSICMWSLFNELHINYLLESKSVEIVKAEKALFTELDKSRPVVAAGCVRDVTRLNAIPDALAANFYPGWYHDTPAAMAGLVDAWCATNARVSLGVSEYGAGGSVKQHQNPIVRIAKPNQTRVHPEEYQAEVHLGQYRALAADPRVWGTFVWCMFDFASDSRSEGELKGINDKGLVTYDRKDCKDAYYLYAANWSTNRILHLVGSRATTCASNRVSVIVFSNVGEVTLRVNGVKVGSMAPDEVHSVRWDGVSLVPGDNEVSVSAGGLVRTAHWWCEAGMGLGSSASVVSPTLPPLFTFSDGTPVRTAADWRRRREEMKKILEHEQYGERPVGKPDGLSFEPLGPDRVMMDGAAVRKRVRIGWQGPVRAGSFTATAFIPTQPKNGPAPAFLLICNRDPAKNIDPERRQKSDFWPAEEIVRRGYAAIAFYNGEVASDHPKTAFTNGVFGCWNLTGERGPHSWGTLSAWAWGASRVLDWIETEPTIDARRVAVIGHSRAGKTALLAAALDERFALACVNNSGCCGAKLHRFSSAGSEYVQRIVDWFPHWFCPHFSRYAGRDAEVPFDQHQLVSLIAPRLCAVGSSADDHWAGQLGEWMSLREASPAWELLGRPGLVPSAMPELAAGVPVPGTCVNSGSLAYHCTAGGHKLAREDWARYMDFADRAMCGRPVRGFVYGIEFQSGDPEEDATRFYLDAEKKTWLDVNYDEAKAGEGTYALEDPLAFVDGRKAKTPADWRTRRK